MIKLKNPITFFIVTWLFVLALYFMRYSQLLTVLKNETIIYILLSCCAFVLSYFFVVLGLPRYTNKTDYFSNDKLSKKLKIIFWIWASLTIVEIIHFRSIPILTFAGIGAGNYTEWGIPSLHGLLNAMIIILSNYNFYLYLVKKDKKYLLRFILCLCWPILLVTRQVFMSMSVQAMLIYIIINKFKTATVLKVCFSALMVVFLFGIVGDLRSGNESFINLVQPSPNYPNFLPSGFLWVYVYVTSPLNNVNYNINLYPSFNLNLVYITSSFFPSFIRDKIFTSASEFNVKLVNEYLNVTSMFPDFLGAFGYFGSIIFYFFMGVFFMIVYVKTIMKNVNIKWVFILAIILHNILFSVFVSFFFNLVFVFQMILHYFIGTKIKLKDDAV